MLNLPTYLTTLRATFAEEVRVIMTPAATSILPASTVALVSDGVFVDAGLMVEKKPGHVELARWADMFVVLPASADLLGQAANGLAPNLLTTAIMASPTPVVFCPNTNALMWQKQAVQRNVATLRRDGHIVVDPEVALAYEIETGQMRKNLVLPEPERLVHRLGEIYDSACFSG